jgi:hypothetical protein
MGVQCQQRRDVEKDDEHHASEMVTFCVSRRHLRLTWQISTNEVEDQIASCPKQGLVGLRNLE